jgi:hypothetical protein
LLAFFLALACLQTWPLSKRLSTGLISLTENRIPDSDVSIFLWDFWWVRKSLVELHQSPAFCNWLGRPGPPVFVFPTLSLQNSLAALPLTAFVSRETAYNILILIILALTGWSASLLASDLTKTRKGETGYEGGVCSGLAGANGMVGWLPAVLAGLWYGTTPLQIRHAGQINVFTLFWIPLVLAAGRRFLATGRPAAAIALGLLFLCNMLAEWYHAVELGILIAMLAAIKVWQVRSETMRQWERKWWPLFVVWGLVYVVAGQFNIFVHVGCWLAAILYFFVLLLRSQEGREIQRLVKRLVVGAIAIGAFAMPVAWPMYRSVQKEPWLRDVAMSAKVVFSADLASYFMPGEMVERLFPSNLPPIANLYGARAHGASDVFPGFAAWAMLIAAIVWRMGWGRRGGEWLLLSGVFLLLSLGLVLKFGGVVEWRFNPAQRVLLPAAMFEFIGILEGIRVFLRFAFVAYLCAAIFVGIQAADWLASVRTRRRQALAVVGMVVATGLLVAERLELPQPVCRVPAVPAFEWLRAQPAGTVLLCPVRHNQYQNLYSQTQHEQAMINPYVSRRPEDVRELVTSHPLLAFLERPLTAPSQALVKSRPDSLRESWNELRVGNGQDSTIKSDQPVGPPTWIVMDRLAYRPPQIAEIGRVLSNLLGLRVVYEDEHYIIYR